MVENILRICRIFYYETKKYNKKTNVHAQE